MSRILGTVVRGLRTPIFQQGDDVVKIVTDTVRTFWDQEKVEIGEKDVLAITESVVARAQGNYAGVDDIAADIRQKFGDSTIGVIFPILSRNRFAINLKGIARGAAKKIILMLAYPSDEVGNHLVYVDRLDEKGVNPWTDVLNETQFREHFGYEKHTFTGIDYIEYYKKIVEAEGKECEILFSNNPLTILDHTDAVLQCDIHSRKRTKKLLKKSGCEKVFGLEDILSSPINGSGYNTDYGLLGSNKATEDQIKLFPRDCFELAKTIQQKLLEISGKKIEVMIYGDGAFKDPVGQIWELADPVVSPGYTQGLEGTPNEIKLKYIADNEFAHLQGEELTKAISDYIINKDRDLTGNMASQGTTPRRITDLIGSLCDLTSGSGDKGTPVIYIQGYFDNYTK
ncbi:MAG: coenzyme F420-0:L-glutamate ligase [Peptostreptococcaceae bacterium]|nr:coenzyme F420-0:L-glutamate ligase [Peptostreptococcaceae bacterium]